jgi:hypothetical protein
MEERIFSVDKLLYVSVECRNGRSWMMAARDGAEKEKAGELGRDLERTRAWEMEEERAAAVEGRRCSEASRPASAWAGGLRES